MKSLNTPNRIHVAVLAALVGSVALVGCKKNDPPAPLPPIAGETAPMPQAGPMATASVKGIDLGNAVGPDMRVTAPMTTFAPTDTIYAAVSTDTMDPAASVASTLGAKWTHIDSNQIVHEENKELVLAGDGVTDFQISRPDPWPTGRYKVEIMMDGNLMQTREFEVR